MGLKILDMKVETNQELTQRLSVYHNDLHAPYEKDLVPFHLILDSILFVRYLLFSTGHSNRFWILQVPRTSLFGKNIRSFE
ncbi:hypothetical protein DPV73_10875 [Leptospira mayottensis]|nr:hypothetical protein DPV73_10875 [Leptospira mayottensis]